MSAPGINKKVFGDDIPQDVKNKLQARQILSKQNRPGESVQFTSEDGKTLDILEAIGEVNFPLAGENKGAISDLSSRTPFARMWTAVQLEKHTKVREIRKKKYKSKPNHIYPKEGGIIIEKKVDEYEKIVYEVGNHLLQFDSVSPNQRVGGADGESGLSSTAHIPNEFESDGNPFMKPAAGVTGVTSETKGSMGLVKETTVSFTVHNFQDYEKIYSKYFLKPGVQVFVDFGWDTGHLYDPRQMLFEEVQNQGKKIEDLLYGPEGYVTRSKGDMESILGFVTTYDAIITPEGKVECSLKIVSKNLALLDYKYGGDNNFKTKLLKNMDREVIGYAAKFFKGGKKLVDPNRNLSEEDQEQYDAAAEAFARKNLSSDLPYPNKQSSRLTGIFWAAVPLPLDEDRGTSEDDYDDDTELSNGKNIYVTWGFVEDKILNENLGMGSSKAQVLEGKGAINYDSSDSFFSYNASLYERQMRTTNLAEEGLQFLYPNRNWGWDYDNGNGTYSTIRGKVPEDHLFDEEGKKRKKRLKTKDDIKLKRIPLREMMVPLSLVKDAVRNNADITGVLKYIFSSINSNSYGIIDLATSSSTQDGSVISVIDKNYNKVDKGGDSEAREFFEGLFVFRPHSPNTICNTYQSSFKTPSGAMQSMIAIQGMSPGSQLFPLDENLDRDLALNAIGQDAQYTVAVIPKIGDLRAKELDKNEADDEYSTEINVEEEDQSILDQFAGAFGKPKGIDDIEEAKEKVEEEQDEEEDESPEEQVESDDGLTQDVKLAGSVSEYYGLLAKQEHFMASSTVLPIEVELGIYGISSIVPGNCFRIDMMPKNYVDNVYFQVLGVKQDITQAHWTTTFTTVMRIRKDKKAADPSPYHIPGITALNTKILSDKKLKGVSQFLPCMKHLKPITLPDGNYIKGMELYSFKGKKNKSFEIGPSNWSSDPNMPSVDDTMPSSKRPQYNLSGSWGKFRFFFDKTTSTTSVLTLGLAGAGTLYDTGLEWKCKEDEDYKLIVWRTYVIPVPSFFGPSHFKKFSELFRYNDKYWKGDYTT